MPHGFVDLWTWRSPAPDGGSTRLHIALLPMGSPPPEGAAEQVLQQASLHQALEVLDLLRAEHVGPLNIRIVPQPR